MDLVLLPHHNTVTELQKLQQTAAQSAQKPLLFVPSYPLVCVLAHADEASCKTDEPGRVSEKLLKKKMQALQDSLKGEAGTLSFEGAAVRNGNLVLPLTVPFSGLISDAGFQAEKERALVLGRYLLTAEAAASKPAPLSDSQVPALDAALPARFRAFRLALMETTPLQADGTLSKAPAAAFSWKFHDAFWVKLV